MAAVLRSDLTDDELEAHIVDCGRLFLKAHGEGDMALARHWLAEEVKAVKSRSPAAVARLEDDYFSYDAEKARMDAQRRAAGG
ncbi:hypothetical protein [Variovorax ginsengisoli]|uniref:Uncharacterized protein n=1 Tax=Variovorax ginsengisoli TaxID=363844 RepID=A0ABT8SG97_9BURK|nr:hypothetical protein [Variovorax ginsengisoli]MDN8617837.1 hypothetical protein [Variovorax ginsengisoli]MDO1537007.1 hypothetical protein [Variovorax ginsengisoli]